MKIVYTGGGTLGSVTPLLALAEDSAHDDKLWIGTHNGPEKDFVTNQQIPFIGIKAFRFRRFFSFKTATELPRLYFSYYKAKKVLKSFRPDVVVTAGSFVGVPVCWAAKKLRIPYIVIQLDVKPGLANKVLFKNASEICVPHDDYKKRISFNTVKVCGIPVSVHTPIMKKNSKQTIVIIGGGTGSKWLNEFVQNKIMDITSFSNVIHIQGDTDRSAPIPVKPDTYTTFFRISREKTLRALSVADLVITRAGMGTLSEMCALAKPTIIVPIPSSHQEENAAFFKQHNAALVVEQKDGYEHLFNAIKDTIIKKEVRIRLSTAISEILIKDSVRRINSIIRKYDAKKS